MTPQEKDQMNRLEQKLNDFLFLYNKENYSNRIEMNRTLVLKDVQNITEFDNFAGLKLGHSSSKVGFFGITPVVKQGAITSPSGGGSSETDAIDISARAAIGQIKTALQNIGITS